MYADNTEGRGLSLEKGLYNVYFGDQPPKTEPVEDSVARDLDMLKEQFEIYKKKIDRALKL